MGWLLGLCSKNLGVCSPAKLCNWAAHWLIVEDFVHGFATAIRRLLNIAFDVSSCWNFKLKPFFASTDSAFKHWHLRSSTKMRKRRLNMSLWVVYLYFFPFKAGKDFWRVKLTTMKMMFATLLVDYVIGPGMCSENPFSPLRVHSEYVRRAVHPEGEIATWIRIHLISFLF
jgi:hypothetical protein